MALALVTVSNSCTLPVLPINLADEPAVKPVPVIVKLIVGPSTSLAFVGETAVTVGPCCFKLLLNIFLREDDDVSNMIAKSASFAVSDNSV